VLRSLILTVFLLAACSPADPPMMIDGSRSSAKSADDAKPGQARAAEEDASAG
jgi:hypothetical protein